MKNILKTLSFCLIISTSIVLTNCKKDNPAPSNEGSNSFTLHFENLMNGNELIFDTQTDSIAPATTFTGLYTNAGLNTFTVGSLRYIISNIVLTKADGTTWAEPESYHFIEVTDATESDEFSLQSVPGGNYTKVTFTLGVDTATNHHLDKAAGDLVGISGMSWTWNTGYIFYKLEGRYKKSDGFYGSYMYHIGLDRNIKTITLDLPTQAIVNKTTASEVHLKNNILATFGITATTGSEIIDISTNPMIMMDPVYDVKIANNNAAAFFKVDHVHNASE